LINLTEESINPRHDLPVAIITTVAIITIIYTLVTIVALSTLGSKTLSHTTIPLADLSQKLFGKYGQIIFKSLAVVSLADTILMTSVAESRSIHSIGETFIPHLNQIDFNQKYKTPFISIAITTIVSFLFVLLLQKVQFTAFYGDLIALIIFVVVNLIAIILRYKRPELHRPYKMPLNIGKLPIISVLGMGTGMYALYKYVANHLFK
jgi:APA family basic amino acid/polyamine antiporter